MSRKDELEALMEAVREAFDQIDSEEFDFRKSSDSVWQVSIRKVRVSHVVTVHVFKDTRLLNDLKIRLEEANCRISHARVDGRRSHNRILVRKTI